jgi:hypothetical protein
MDNSWNNPWKPIAIAITNSAGGRDGAWRA